MNLKYFFELTEARKQATGSHLARTVLYKIFMN